MEIKITKKFSKDRQRQQKRGKDLKKLKSLVLDILGKKNLSPLRKDHKLNGEYVNYRECHVEPDWLLIYKKTETALVLVRTGTHADLF
jgi:mRNA interferase YafQ